MQDAWEACTSCHNIQQHSTIEGAQSRTKQGNAMQLWLSAPNGASIAMHTKSNNSCGDATAAAAFMFQFQSRHKTNANHPHQCFLIRSDGTGNLRDTSCKGCCSHTIAAMVDDGLAHGQQPLQRREGRRVSNKCWICVAHSRHPHVKEERHAPICMHADTCWSNLLLSMSRIVGILAVDTLTWARQTQHDSTVAMITHKISQVS